MSKKMNDWFDVIPEGLRQPEQCGCDYADT
jgi:hypothetical protein